MARRIPLKRELPTHHIDGRIKFGIVLAKARKSLALDRSVAARTGVPLATDRFTRVRDAMGPVRTDISGAAAFWVVTNVPVAEGHYEQRTVPPFAWTEPVIDRRYSAEEIAAAQAAALEVARYRDAAPVRRAA